MEPVKIGIPGVQDRRGGGQSASRRRKKRRRRAADEAADAEPLIENAADILDLENGDETSPWPGELRLGRHLNVVV